MKKDQLIAIDAKAAIDSLKVLPNSIQKERLTETNIEPKIYVTPEFSDLIHNLLVEAGHPKALSAIWPPIEK